MGRIGLHRLLTAGLILILFSSFLLSAVGVAVMVRQYLWRTGVDELQATARSVDRFLGVREGEDAQARRQRRNGRFQNVPARGFRRPNGGRGEVYLLKAGKVVRGAEDGDPDWGDTFAGLTSGVHLVDHEGERWQVFSQPIDDEEYDQVVVARRWSPFLRIVRTLVGYQIFTMTIVLGLAIVAVRALTSRIVGPLEELRAWSERLGQAKMKPLGESNIDEVASLQHSFSQMGHRVEEALDSHRRFVADASHELKTPLTAISGMLELLESRPEMSAEDRQQALTVAKKESARMATLVSDLLVLSRAQAKRSGQRDVRFLAPLIEEQLTTLRLLFPAQVFESRLDPAASWSVNPDALARIVRNLVENAAHHAGGKPIAVTLEKAAGGLAMRVIDRGPGIDAEKLPQLFQRFYRMDEGRSRDQGGFGLGLAIVEALVAEVGGDLSCESVKGQGTTFTVLFKKRSA